ncbi:hypothetical protein CC78DRAFT_421159, partial [Lojkania enalia]
MLSDGKIDSLDTRLEQFRLNNQANQNELQVVLKEYSQLLEGYKSLKNACEGKAINGGTNVDKSATDKPRNPYVLVLIDGNGYILVKEKEEGGMRAARMLNDCVEKYLRDSCPETRNYRIIVRIYADLTTLSKSLAKSKLVGLEKRSLASFTAGFTRGINLFDFVDALDEEGTKFKIREMFQLAAGDSACSHILYGACHDASYLSLMVPFSGMRNKISLLQAAGFSNEFHQFNLGVTQFPTLFRFSDVNGASWRTKGEPLKPTAQVPCKYFQKGFCRLGNACKFQHSPAAIANAKPLNGSNRSNISAFLPTSLVPNFIPLNKDNHRLDIYLKPPTQDEWAIYNARFRRQKPCNNHYLQGKCTTFNCPYDHSELEPEARRALEYVLKCTPCPKKGACRASDCFHGHICQKDACMGHIKGCKMKADLHNVDPKLASMVPA